MGMPSIPAVLEHPAGSPPGLPAGGQRTGRRAVPASSITSTTQEELVAAAGTRPLDQLDHDAMGIAGMDKLDRMRRW